MSDKGTIRRGDVDARKEHDAHLKKRKSELKCTNHKKGTKFLAATLLGDVKQVTTMLEKSAKSGDGLIGAKDEKTGENALHLAAESGSKETIQVIISRGGDVGSANLLGQTPLHVAAKRNLMVSVKALIAAGANIRSLDAQKKTPLWYIIRNQDDPLFTLFLDSGISLEEDVSPIGGPLHEACTHGYSKGVAILLKRGAKIDKRHPTSGNTPLHVAAISGSSASVLALLGYGGDKEAVNKLGFKPQDLALQAGHKDISDIIAKYVFDSNHRGFQDVLTENQKLEEQKEDLERKIAQLSIQRNDALKNGDSLTAKKMLEQTHDLEEQVLEIEDAILTLEEKELEEREFQNRQKVESRQASTLLLPDHLSSGFRGSIAIPPNFEFPAAIPEDISSPPLRTLQPSISSLPLPPPPDDLPPPDL